MAQRKTHTNTNIHAAALVQRVRIHYTVITFRLFFSTLFYIFFAFFLLVFRKSSFFFVRTHSRMYFFARSFYITSALDLVFCSLCWPHALRVCTGEKMINHDQI